MYLNNIVVTEDLNSLTTEELLNEIEFLTNGSGSTEGIAEAMFKAIASFIARVLYNVKAKLDFINDLPRTPITAYLESHPFELKDTIKRGYQEVYKKEIPVYTWKTKVTEMPNALTDMIDKLRVDRTINKTITLIGEIEAGCSQNDSDIIVKNSMELVNSTLMPKEVQLMTRSLTGMVNINQRSNRVEFGAVFSSMKEFEVAVNKSSSIGTKVFNSTTLVAKELNRIYFHMDNIIEIFKKGEVKIDGAAIKQLTRVFTALDDYLQLYGSLVKELNAYETFLVNCLSALNPTFSK